VRLWDLPAIKEKGSLAGDHIGPVMSLAFGADDQTLVIGAGDNSNNTSVGQVRVVDFEQSANRFDKTEHRDVAGSVAVSPSNQLLAAGYWEGTIKVWDFNDGTERFSLTDPAGVNTVAFAADSKTLASGGPGDAIKLWDLTTGKERQSLKTEAGGTMGLAFSADGKKLASAHQDGWLIVWDAASGKRVEGWQLPGAINAVAFAVDSRHLATGNSNGTVYVFRLAAYQPRKKETGKTTEMRDGN
jgi:WD40 repeat protein